MSLVANWTKSLQQELLIRMLSQRNIPIPETPKTPVEALIRKRVYTNMSKII